MNNLLVKYIEVNVFPEYSKNDSGHNLVHIKYVIDRCMLFSKQFDNINLDILYTIASFHDIAHHIDKKNHEKLSAQIFYENEDMKHFFTEEQRIIIKEGIEDHRASSNSIPRSDYGKILSSADRSTDVNDFLKRTHAYTMKHNPDATVEEMVERAYNHTKEKYGNNGYAKNFVLDNEYNLFKKEILQLINNKNLFVSKYLKINNIF
jgi:uncharacterized protein